MGIIIKKRFGPRNFVQQLGFKDVYSIGPKKKKSQQVRFDNPQEYIIPQNDINEFTKDMQQSYNIAQKGSSKTFANYYGGTGDTRGFMYTAKPLPPVATSMDRLGEDYDRSLAISVRNRNRARHLAEGLAGQKMEYLKELIFGKKTRGKFLPIRSWPYRAREQIALNESANQAADNMREFLDSKYTLPGYFHSWVSRTGSLDPKLLGKAAFLRTRREIKTKAQILELAKQLVHKKDSRLRRIAENVYEAKRAELMTAVDLERGGTSGGFFSQVGTNLYATQSAKKLMDSAKKSPRRVDQDQQTSPMSATKSVKSAKKATPLSSGKKSSPLESATEMFKRVSTKALTPEQEASLAGRFKYIARNMQRGAAVLGLLDPPDDPKARRKLLITPGGTPGLPA